MILPFPRLPSQVFGISESQPSPTSTNSHGTTGRTTDGGTRTADIGKHLFQGDSQMLRTQMTTCRSAIAIVLSLGLTAAWSGAACAADAFPLRDGDTWV